MASATKKSAEKSATVSDIRKAKAKRDRRKAVVESRLRDEARLVTPTLGTILNADVDEIAVDDLAVAATLVTALKKVATARYEALKLAVFDVCDEAGTVPDPEKGHKVFHANSGDTLIKEKRQGKSPDPDLIKELLIKKGRNWKDVFTRVDSYVLNEALVEQNVTEGKLTNDEVEQCKKVTYAMKIEHSEKLEKLLEEVLHELQSLPE